MKIIFLGTPDIAVPVINQILNSTHKISLIFTQPDKPVGRSKALLPSPVAEIALLNNLEIIKTEKIDCTLIEKVKQLNADLFIIFAYGVILPKSFLESTKYGGINIHPSLLPELRGPSPIQTAILQGKTKSGITVQKVALKVDSGDIVYQQYFDITKLDDEITLEKKVAEISGNFIIKILNDIEKTGINGVPQDDNKATFCKMINKKEGLIDWNDNSESIFNKIRAFTKWPVAYTFLDGKKINIYKAEINVNIENENFTDNPIGSIVSADKNKGLVVKCNNSYLKIITLQLEGKKIMSFLDFLNGSRNLKDKVFVNGV